MTQSNHPSIPLFTERASASIARAEEIYTTRGNEYSDDWRERRCVTLQAVARELGIVIPPEHERAIVASVFCDAKYWRGLGGYRDDSLIDGINYQAFLAEEMRSAAEGQEVKPSIRLHIELFEGADKRTLLIDLKDIPAGMTPKRCACWMLAKAAERLGEPTEVKPRD